MNHNNNGEYAMNFVSTIMTKLLSTIFAVMLFSYALEAQQPVTSGTQAQMNENLNNSYFKTLSDKEMTVAEMDDYLKAQMDSFGLPGLSIAIINDAKIIYHRTLGVTNVDTKEKVSEETLF
jgi:CubicO group peptidase (beta-lactamase class C family)